MVTKNHIKGKEKKGTKKRIKTQRKRETEEEEKTCGRHVAALKIQHRERERQRGSEGHPTSHTNSPPTNI